MPVIFIPLAESAELAFLGIVNRVLGCASFLKNDRNRKPR